MKSTLQFFGLTFLVALFSSAAWAGDCSSTLKASLLNDVQTLEAGYRTTSPLYQNYDQSIGRLRRLVKFSGTLSFADYFSRNGDIRKIYFISNGDGTYRSVHTDAAVANVIFCDTDYQNVPVTIKTGGLPLISINIVCGSDTSIISEGEIEFYSNSMQVRGGNWKKNGVNTTCDGATSITTSYYTEVSI